MSIKRTAIIALDPQNDFFTPQGKFYNAMEPVLTKYQIVANMNKVLEAGRNAGATIILVPLFFDPGCPEAGAEPYGIMKPVAESESFIRGTWGAELAESLSTRAGDIIIPKNHISGFEQTNLEAQLRDKNIDTVVLCGGLTDVCVETTMRQAYDKRFNVFSITDATATVDLDKHEQTIEQSYPLFSKPLSAQEFIQMLDTWSNKAA
jgi:nicotinamidase-related amidase